MRELGTDPRRAFSESHKAASKKRRARERTKTGMSPGKRAREKGKKLRRILDAGVH